MKKSILLLTSLCVFAFVFLAACFSGSSASFEELVAIQNAQKTDALKELVGTWEGSYYATQGETGLTLDVYEENGKYMAIFRFYNLPGKTNVEAGSYRMGVSYILGKGTTKKYDLNFQEWIERPNDYGSLDLSGMLDGNIFKGKTDYDGDFNVVRKDIVATRNAQPIEPFAQQKGTFTDPRDKKVYKTVKIGKQTWMAENLNYDAEGSRCYDNKPENCVKYGRLYYYSAATSICPNGWHLPSDSEYKALDEAVGGEKAAVEKLKSKSGWNKDGNGTDDYGFSALPGGYGASHDSDDRFDGVGLDGCWWSDSEDYGPYGRSMSYKSNNVSIIENNVPSLFSVRCLQD